MKRGHYFQSNRKTRVFLEAVSDLTGKRGLLVLLQLADLHAWLDNPPPYNDILGVDFSDVTTISKMLLFMYGPHGGGGLATRAGRMMFRAVHDRYGETLTPGKEHLKMLSEPQRAQTLLQALVKSWPQHSDGQASLREKEHSFLLELNPCPELWGQHTPESCYGTIGFLQDALEWCELGDIYQITEIPHANSEDSHIGRFEIDQVAAFGDGLG